MSKARLVITAVTVEKCPVSEVARAYGVARSWIYALLARYQAEGDAAFEPRSRRPVTSPSAISLDAADLIVRLRKELAGQGLDAGPHTIATWMQTTGTALLVAERRTTGADKITDFPDSSLAPEPRGMIWRCGPGTLSRSPPWP
jgi:hypothetical protein